MAKATDYTKLTPEELVALLVTKDAELTTKDAALATKDAELSASKKEVETAKAAQAKSEEIIGELKTELVLKEEEVLNGSGEPIVKYGKDTYVIQIKTFKLWDSDARELIEYTAQDVQKNEKLCAILIKSKSEVLRKK